MTDAAAALDPATGRIVGYVAPRDGRPGKVTLTIDGRPVGMRVAAQSATALGASGFAVLKKPPPTAQCAFAAKLPRSARGKDIAVLPMDGGAALLEAAFDDDRALARYREGSTMADSVSFDGVRLQGGVFRAKARVHGGGPAPQVTLRVKGENVAEAEVKALSEIDYAISAPAPVEAFGDGVSVVEFVLADGSVAERYPVAAGVALAGDLASELASLRAEFDQLKRTFRSAVAGGVLTRDERPMIVAEALTEVDNLLEMRDRAEQAHLRAAEAADFGEDDAEWEIDE